MTILNKFIVFQCDVCRRLKEIKINSNRIDPIRCVITNKCRGRLKRVGESSVKKFLLTPPTKGLQDFTPRGSVIAPIHSVTKDPDIPLSTGNSVLTMAVLNRTLINGAYEFSVLGLDNTSIPVSTLSIPNNLRVVVNVFPISSSALQSTTYNFIRVGAVYNISGPDDSPISMNLRFSDLNLVKVFINGIELLSSAYTISVPNQQITFTPTIYESNNVITIIVYNDLLTAANLSNTVPLDFYTLDPTLKLPLPDANLQVSDFDLSNSTAWGDVKSVDIPNVGTRYLMHCGNLSGLVNDTSYCVSSVQVIVGPESIYAGSFVIGLFYQILIIGTTSFTDIGSSENSVGVLFRATDIGIGSGSAKPVPMSIVNAGHFIPGLVYTVETVGNTDYMAIGAISNRVGVMFTAKGPGIGTGTAWSIADPVKIHPNDVHLLLASDPYSFSDKELNAYLSGTSFTTSFSFKYNADPQNGIYELNAPQSSFTQLLTSMVPSNKVSSTILSNQSVVGTVLPASTIKHKYIIGPT